MDAESTGSPDATEDDVIEIEPIEDYNFQKAKLRASLLWLLHKAYSDDVPAQLLELFYETEEGTMHLQPRLVNLLVASEIYCQACCQLFHDTSSQWQGHWSIIQVLSRKGIYVMETEEVVVTATVLGQTAPFRVNAHLALIDALMKAYTSELVTVPRVVQAVRQFASFNASSELPSTEEEAIVFWLNKVCVTILHRLEKERREHQQQLLEGETTQKVRITRKQLCPKELPHISPLEDLVKDVGDGCSLAATISFYCPHLLKLNDICLKSNLGIADSLYNLRLIRTFCERRLPQKCFHLVYVDLLYSHHSMRDNFLVFLAELFSMFEVEKPECLQAGSHVQPSSESRPITASRISSANVTKPTVPISDVTKRSFHKSHVDDIADLNIVAPSPTSFIPPRQTLLPKRLYQDDGPPQESHKPRSQWNTEGYVGQSILAWQEGTEVVPQDRRMISRGQSDRNAADYPEVPQTSANEPDVSQSNASNLLANVSIDTELMESYGSVDISGLGKSIDLETPEDAKLPASKSPRSPLSREFAISDPLEIQSITSASTSTQMSHQMGLRSCSRSPKGEPLFPARLRTPKEKTSSHSKAEERGDNSVSSSFRKPGNPAVKRVNNRQLPEVKMSSQSHSPELSVKISSESSDSVLAEEMIITPLPPEQLAESFQIEPADQPRPLPIPSHSYSIPDVVQTTEAAVAAGIPVLSESHESGGELPDYQRQTSRQGSVASNRSSGEFSDHESHKIHQDHKAREFIGSKECSPNRTTSQNDLSRPDTLPVAKPVVVKPMVIDTGNNKTPLIIPDQNNTKNMGQTTSFAQIKQLRDDGQFDNSGYVFMQHGQESNGNGVNRISLKAAFQRKQADGSKGGKRATFAALPNQTTWQQSAQTQRQYAGRNPSHQNAENGDTVQPMPSELLQVRMKLEEKRRAIEREKHRMELQKNKQRQRLKKAAFMQVLSKTKDGQEHSIPESAEGSGARLIVAEGRVSPMPLSASASVSAPVTSGELSHRDTGAELMHSSAPPGGSGRPTRAFSREDIQQTIENVKKKWFGGDENGASYDYRPDASRATPPLQQQQHKIDMVAQRSTPAASTAMSRMTPPLQQPRPDLTETQRMTPPLQQLRQEPPATGKMTPPLDSQAGIAAGYDVRRTPSLPISIGTGSSPRQTPPLSKDGSKEIENYEEYNSSLDKLNHSLSELQGEIMRLSLQQEQMKKLGSEPIGPVVPPNQLGTSTTGGPQVRTMPPPSSLWPNTAQPGQSSKPTTQAIAQGGRTESAAPSQHPAVSYPAVTNPYGHGQPHQAPHTLSPGALQSGQFVIHANHHQHPSVPFSAVPGTYPSPGQYDAYIPPGQPPFSLQSPPMYPPQVYNQSPPYPGQPQHPAFIMHPGSQFQPPPVQAVGGYQPHTQYNDTYTVASHSQPHLAPGFAHGTSPRRVSQEDQSFQNVVADKYRTHSEPPNVPLSDSGPDTGQFMADFVSPYLKTDSWTVSGMHATPSISESGHRLIGSNSELDGAMPPGGDFTPANQNVPLDEQSSAGGIEGFFVSFGSETPKRPKPKLGKDRSHGNRDASPAARGLAMNGPTLVKGTTSGESDTSLAQSASPEHNTSQQGDPNVSGIGFVIGEDDTSLDKSQEDEMQRKKEKMIQLQQKRREEGEKKRLEKESQEAEKREKERKKQEETEQKRNEEKSRRETIFREYKARKAKEAADESGIEVRTRPEKSARDKPRPKSMIVKARSMMGQNGAIRTGGGSQDDIPSLSRDSASGTSVRLAPKRGRLYRPASCHLMDTAGTDTRSSFTLGGLTHRRPPSPDLYSRSRKGTAKGQDSNSETGSATGSDYCGPKLYSKPSQKSNRHIMNNAISHCCLAGTVNTDLKNKVLEEIARSDAKHFLILFRDAGCQYRGLYTFDPDTEQAFKILGVGPKQLTNKMIEMFYKYNSGAKKFTVVGSMKHLSVSIDAIVIHGALWKPTKQPSSKR